MNKELTYEQRVRWFVNNYYETGMEYASMLESMKNKDLDNFEWYGEKIQIPKFYKLPQQKTFGSKDMNDNEIKSQILSEKYQQYRDWLNEIPEISDEEIEKASQETYPLKKKDFMYIPTYGVINLEDSDKRFDINQRLKQIGFIAGIKWYREQLKK
jgi:hypothetical protein